MRTRDQLYAYQKRAVDFVKQNANCALWMDMGLGKSAVTMTAVTDLMERFESRRALIVAPLRVARKVFSDEAREWDHLKHLRFSKIISDRRVRRSALIQPGEFHTVNRENLAWLVDTFFDDKGRQKRFWPYDTVILDESQSFMSQSALRWKKMRHVRKLFPRMIQLTGTPSPRKGYAALWAQMFLLDRGERLGRTEDAFRRRWFD
ncbi:MAG: DEAD/DEAH box helicase family protein, partial [Minisyncoccia bacterium]